MAILLLLLGILMLLSIRIHFHGLDTQYLSKDYTASIKGIFIMLVFISHARSYFDYTMIYDQYTIQFMNTIGQLMVTLFLFYSGYGVFVSIEKKQEQYVNKMPVDRILKTLFDFVLALILFVILGLYLGKKYTISKLLLACTGLVSIGNSNWYMFVIFTLYIMTYFVFKLWKKKYIFALISMTILSLIYIYVIRDLQPDRFCNTYLCYALGMWYAYGKNKVDQILNKYSWSYYLVLLMLLLVFICIYPLRYIRIMNYNGLSMIFCLIVVFFSMKITFKSKLLIYFGNMLFWIYILQRIPMSLIKHFNLGIHSSFQVLLSLIFTLIMAYLMNELSKNLKKVIFK